MSIAQDKTKANFKKAIAYRSKTGCSLKEAFAHIKGKKTVIKKKAIVKKVGAIKKKITPKKVSKKKAPKKLKYAGTAKAQNGKKMYKYSLGKKPNEKSILNKIHKVKKDVEKLDESQHKHMSKISGVRNLEEQRTKILKSINEANYQLRDAMDTKIYPGISLKQKQEAAKKIKWYKEHLKTLKLHLKERT